MDNTESNRLQVNIERIMEKLDVSSSIGTTPNNGLCRLALSDEDKLMRDRFVDWLKKSRLEVRVDDFGNIYGRRPGINNDLSPIMIGSHLDTQPKGGRYDGILGVILALEVIEVLNENGIETERPIEVVNFTSEEGSRFEPPMLGSGGITEEFSSDFVLSRKDETGVTFGEELERIGYQGSKDNRNNDIHSFVELHIEQGPYLYEKGLNIGAVKGIQGISWLEVKLIGEDAHAGTAPMASRKDALLTASKIRTAIQNVMKEIDPEVKLTVGRMIVGPNIPNCVPSEVEFSIDIRAFNDSVREKAVEYVKNQVIMLAAMDNIDLTLREEWNVPSTYFSEEIVDLVLEASEEFGYPAEIMVSGAGHDAKYMNNVTKTGMIFVPSVDGKSHSEDELTFEEDIHKGANVLLYVLLALAKEKTGITHNNNIRGGIS